MKDLIYKELRLSLHPTALLFLALSALIVIPNYPYYVTFFYTGLGIFFICLSGRENQDIFYMMLLPIAKGDIVKARFALVLLIELAQMLIAIPAVLLRNALIPLPNQVGMDANIALFGLSLVLLGIFNLSFLTRYYRDPDQVGKPFAFSATLVFLYIAVMEAGAHICPFMGRLDTPDPQYLPEKLLVLAAGLIIFLLLTAISYTRSRRSFEKLDL